MEVNLTDFIDDIFIVSKTEEDHYMILEKTLKAFAEAKLKVKLEKTELFITSVIYWLYP